MQPLANSSPASAAPDQQTTRSVLRPTITTSGLMARLACLACSAFLWTASTLLSPLMAATPFAAGFETLQAADGADKPLEVAVWYPTEAVARQVDMGPFTMNIALGGAIGSAVAGRALPLIVISHGNGGATMSHHDTAVALAQAGFVVAAVAHTGDNHADQSRAASMMDRPRHISRVIDHMLTQWPGKDRIDATRIGVFGHSSGAFTALATVGGAADLARIAPHCQQRPGDYPCQLIGRQPAGTAALVAAMAQPSPDARVRAAVVAAPALGFTFTQASLGAISVPVQLWRAHEDTVLPHPWYVEPVRAALPQPLDYHDVANAGHFDFLAPCTARFAAMAPPLCSSQAGFDREAFHRDFNASVVGFFKTAMNL